MIVRELLFSLGFSAVNAERNAKRMDGIVSNLRQNLINMGKAAVVSSVALAVSGSKIADEYTGLESRLKLVTKGAEELKSAQDGIYDVAQKTGTAYAASSDLYIRLARSTKKFNYSQEQTLKVTEAIQKAMVVSGDAASPGAQAALFQLGQGLQSGTLRGEELNSVLEQAPRLAEAIAAGMGIDPGDLRKQAEKGNITAQRVVEALLGQYDMIDAEFKQMENRASQGWQRVVNSFKREVYKMSKEEGSMEGVIDVFAELQKTIESEDFRTAFRSLISLFSLLLKILSEGIRLITKFIGTINRVVGAMGGWERALSTLGALLASLFLIKMATMIVSLYSLIAALGFSFTATYAMATAMGALSLAMKAIPLVAIATALTLLFQDLYTWYNGGDSVFKRLFESEAIKEFLGYLKQVWKIMKFIVPGGRAVTNLMSGSSLNGDQQQIGSSMFGRTAAQNSLVFQPAINVNVPYGTGADQAKLIATATQGAMDEMFQRQIRAALNDYPETE
jgi:tape measure domain-containing protein